MVFHWLKILEQLRKEQQKQPQQPQQPQLEIPAPNYHYEDLPRFEDMAPEVERGVTIIDYNIQKD